MIRKTNTRKTGSKPASRPASAGRSASRTSSRAKSEGRRPAAPKRASSPRRSDSDAPKRTFKRRSDSDAPKRTFKRRLDSDAPKRTFKRRSETPVKETRVKRTRGDFENVISQLEGREAVAGSRKPRAQAYTPKPRKPKATGEEGIRLNRFIANSGICSRREADEYIVQGVVTVNGQLTSSYRQVSSPLTDRLSPNWEPRCSAQTRCVSTARFSRARKRFTS